MNKERVLHEHFSELGRKGGLKGGKARMKLLTPRQRTNLAKKAAAARWAKRVLMSKDDE
jgi:hypothetical protein